MSSTIVDALSSSKQRVTALAKHWIDGKFEARAEDLVQLLATENGKIIPHARFETAILPFTLRFNAALALTDYGRATEVDNESLSIVIRQPVGVAGVVAPLEFAHRAGYSLPCAGLGCWVHRGRHAAATDRASEFTDL
jgi:acyl-CoA reductase-like NAD-dependent aldehyde dehydrogenase